MKCKRLYNKIVRWFKEKRGMSNFECRFTGEETKKFCDVFTYLILVNIDEDIEKPSNVFPLFLYKMGIHLRNSISLAREFLIFAILTSQNLKVSASSISIYHLFFTL
jgi:hypothetical protein